MWLVVVFNCVVLATLIRVARRRGLEEALPYFAFFVILAPEETKFRLGGLFDLSTQRLALIALCALYLTSRKNTKPGPLPLKRLIVLSLVWLAIASGASLLVTTSLKQVVAQAVEYYLF